MTERERLIELLGESFKYIPWGEIGEHTAEEVADYLLANGVIVPPVKVGDKLYVIAELSKKIIECTIIGVWLFENKCTVITDSGTIHTKSIGKTVFLTREEAEKALVNYESSKRDGERKENE